MFEALGNLVNNIGFGAHERKVKRYLEDATTDSVLSDLTEVLTSKIREISHQHKTFQAYCIRKPDQPPYWTDISFNSYIGSVHPSIDACATQLLWRCFHFYAYHPFPRDFANARIDQAAFQRAAAFLVARGIQLLGMQDEGSYYWRHDEAFFRKVDFQRVFRSLGQPAGMGTAHAKPGQASTSALEDVMDVLSMTLPLSVNLAPSPDQLSPVAQKLLDECAPSRANYRVARKDLLILLELLLCLRLQKSTWGPRFHLGTLTEVKPGDRELADVMVAGVRICQDEDSLTPDEVLRVIGLLPNIQLRFYQLWSVLFQPTGTDGQVQPDDAESMPARIPQAISLFVPRHNISTASQTATVDTWLIPEPLSRPPEDTERARTMHLFDYIAHDPHPHVVLASDGTTPTSATIIGAYLPGPLWQQGPRSSEKQAARTSSSHLLFQLTPRFRILQWTGPSITLKDLVHANHDSPASETDADVASDEKSPMPYTSYTIGAPEGEGASLRIDLETRSAALKSRAANSEAANRYELLEGGTDKVKDQDWTAIVERGRVDVFRVSGAMEAELGGGTWAMTRNKARYAPATAPVVGGPDLAKRIEGFGSG